MRWFADEEITVVERKDLKAGARYNYQDKGIPGPVVVVVEKIEGGMVTARRRNRRPRRRG